MSFFNTEKSSSRIAARARQLKFSSDDNELLRREITIDGPSGFHRSPYELFRQNVANYCERYMLESFEPTDCMSAGEKAAFAYRNCCRKSSRRSCDDEESTLNSTVSQDTSKILENGNNISKDPSSLTTTTSNAFSVLSVAFQPADTDESNKKKSFLKKISQLMNNCSSNKISFTQHAELKQHQNILQWNSCECNVHIGKHNNCCQCQEPYHRTNCECVQHSGSHSYCCRCDIHLLQQYDQYLKKKKYLRLYSGEEGLPAPNSTGILNNVDPGRPSTSQTGKTVRCEDRGLFTQDFINENMRFPHQEIHKFSKDNHDYHTNNTEWAYAWKKDNDKAQSENIEEHPCELCCKKLDDVYGTALREVHSMLVDVSRSLAPSMNCCALDSLIKDSFLRHKPLHAATCSQDHRMSVEIQEHLETERPSYNSEEFGMFPRSLNRQSDVAIQVNTYSQAPNETSRGKRLKDSLRRKIFKKENTKICVIS